MGHEPRETWAERIRPRRRPHGPAPPPRWRSSGRPDHAAVLLRVGNAHPAQLAQLLDSLLGKLIVLIHQKREGLDLLLRKTPDLRAQLFVRRRGLNGIRGTSSLNFTARLYLGDRICRSAACAGSRRGTPLVLLSLQGRQLIVDGAPPVLVLPAALKSQLHAGAQIRPVPP